MRGFDFAGLAGDDTLEVLCLGAHCDDIEIGCGGTLLAIAERVPRARFTWAMFCANDVRQQESERAAKLLLEDRVTTRFWRFRDGFLPYLGQDVKDAFESLKVGYAPHLVFTHTRGDLHQDHRLVAELTWNTFRNHAIFEYEIPKYDADLSCPNVFVPLTADHVQKKVDAIVEAYATQRNKQWFDDETLRSLMRIRGIECASPTRYAEAFHGRKIVVG